MPLTEGTRLGPYEVVAPIGAGGMGEVYRAHDTELDRDVAIKVLPESFSGDPERLARFEREAKLLASLNHPNIASIFGLEKSGDERALVMELIEGPTLAERIAEGRIPVDEALPLATQITEALAAAHAQGIIHRDLKPANIKITPDGTIKVLDFGLAKALLEESPNTEVSQSPTLTKGTAVGVILGTASYMSPEQAKGKAVDKRTDIWAFGCVLYEMLTGRKAFPGDDVSEALAAVIRAEPDFDALPASTTAGVRRALQRCLAKDTKERLADISDARLELTGSDELTPASSLAFWQQPKWMLLAALLLVALATFVARRIATPPASDVSPVRYVVSLPEGDTLNVFTGGLAVSSDGRRLAYVATRDGIKQIFVRDRSSVDARPIAGTAGARAPFFSPDGEWLAFFDDESLLKVSMSGGAPERISDAPYSFDGSWGSDDTIVFGTQGDLLRSVSAAGGEPTTIVASNQRARFLPDGQSLLVSRANPQRLVTILDLASGDERELIAGVQPHYVDGYLVVGRDGSLWAAPFDLARGNVSGPAAPVAELVQTQFTAGAPYGVARDGSLTFVPRTREPSIVIVDPQGEQMAVTPLPSPHSIQLSPDKRRVAGDNSDTEVWIHELDTGTRLQIATGAIPTWSPDGAELAYMVISGGREVGIGIKASDGTGDERILLDEQGTNWPISWSPDGEWLAVVHRDDNTSSFDVWMVAMTGEFQEYLATPAHEDQPAFSPDGRWVAYRSDQSGRGEVYVEPFPGPGNRVIVSAGGGTEPLWSPDGNELYYRKDTTVLAVPVDTRSDFSVLGTPRAVVDGPYWLDSTGHTAYGVFPDGKLLLIDTGQANEIHVVLNWVEELKRRVPAGE